MTYAIRCTKVGICEFVDGPGRHRCPLCGKMHTAYQCGAPPKQRGGMNVIPEIRPYFDFGAGVQITSRAQRRRAYRERGMNLNSTAEHKRHHGDGCWNPGRVISYPGQQNHTSAAEREGVRTKDGRRVV